MAVTTDDVREYGRFGDHITDDLIDRALGMATREANGFLSRIPEGRYDDVVLLLACHYVALTDRQPQGVSDGQLSVSYGSPVESGLCETSFGREVERLLKPLPRVL